MRIAAQTPKRSAEMPAAVASRSRPLPAVSQSRRRSQRTAVRHFPRPAGIAARAFRRHVDVLYAKPGEADSRGHAEGRQLLPALPPSPHPSRHARSNAALLFVTLATRHYTSNVLRRLFASAATPVAQWRQHGRRRRPEEAAHAIRIHACHVVPLPRHRCCAASNEKCRVSPSASRRESPSFLPPARLNAPRSECYQNAGEC